MSGEWLALGAVAALAAAGSASGSMARWDSAWWTSQSKPARVGFHAGQVFRVGNRFAFAFDKDLNARGGFDPELRWTFDVVSGHVTDVRATNKMKRRYHLVRNPRDFKDPWDRIVDEVRWDLQRQLRVRPAGSMARVSKARLKKGTTLYHGTQAVEDFEIPDGPAWFSDGEDVSREFVTWNEAGGRPRILVYEVTTSITGLVLINNAQDMKQLVRELFGEDDDGYCGIQELAEAVCDAGYNGWHTPWNYPSGSDTMLCDPERWVTFVEEIEP